MDTQPVSNDDKILARMRSQASARFENLKEDLQKVGVIGLAVTSAAPVLKVGVAAAALSQVSPMIDSHIVTIADLANSYGVAAAGVAATMSAVVMAHYAPLVKQWASNAFEGAAKLFRREDAKANLFGGLKQKDRNDPLPMIMGADAVYKQMDFAGVLVDHNDNTVEYKRGDVRVETGDRVIVVSPEVANIMLDLEDQASNRMTGQRFETDASLMASSSHQRMD